MNESITCALCGRVLPESDGRLFDEQLLCTHCLAERTVTCTRCRRRIWVDDNAGTVDTPLCQACFDDNYTTCVECGCLLHLDDAYYTRDDYDHEYPRCWSCHEREQDDRVIHDYYYKPEPIFYGDGLRYFGVELEIDGAGEDDCNARAVLSAAHRNGLEYIYCKHDGSLNDGFEIVTHPMSYAFHMNEMPWGAILDKARRLGYQSHLARTCGLHIHVSREAFGCSESVQDRAIARVLYFFEKHWEELLKFSRRTQSQLDHWACRYGYKEQPRDILEHAKKGCHAGRYTCVNLENHNTIEFRIFRGTLKLNSLLATLQFVNRVCDVAIHFSDDDLKDMSWTTFVSTCTEPELVQYLKERRLYVNDPVEQEVDV